MTRLPLLTAAVCVALAGPAFAEDVKPPPAENAQLKFFEGKWSCEGKVHKTAMGSVDHDFTIAQTISGVLKDRWMHTASVESHRGPKESDTMESWSLFGWDVASKKFILFGATSSGSSMQASSSGWSGDTWIWTGEGGAFSGKAYASRMSYVKKGAAEMEANSEISVDGGKTWLPFRESHCKK